MEPQPDEDLRLAQAADIESLYRKYAKRCLAFLASLNVKGADAEDVNHQAWLRVCKTLESKTFEGNFRAWLFQILRNAAIDQFRKKKPELLDPVTAEQSLANDDSPDAGLIEAEYQSQIKKCIDLLAPASKTLMQLRLAGQDYNLIANKLGIDVTKAHRLFFDVKQSMANCLNRRGGQA
jgi:RNA polymerase sigma factor (sigma-70 family)